MTDDSTSGVSGEPPGWYADPWERADQRWWNGHEWSDQTRAAPVEQLRTEGWYDDPNDGTIERWWDGRKWTNHTRPASEAKRALTEWKTQRESPSKAPAAQAPTNRTRAKLVGALLLGLVAMGWFMGACSGDNGGSTGRVGGGSFDEALEDGADCGRLFDLRNELLPDDPEVARMNNRLRDVGCFTSSSTRTD